MQLTLKKLSPGLLARYAAIGLFSASLAACGGGGGSPGTVGGGTTGGGTGGTVTNPVVTAPTVTLKVTDGASATVTSLSGSASGTVKATVLSATGTPVANAIVTFTNTDPALLAFTPASGSALTDATGVAVIGIKPFSFTAAGAVGITSTVVVDGKTATASTNISIGAAPLTVGTLSFTPAPTGSLPAFSTAALNVPITSGGQPATVVTGLVLNSDCVGDLKATLVPGPLTAGVQSVTYTNLGCLRGTDKITASVGNSSQSILVNVDPAAVGSVQFVSSSAGASSIVLKGSGGIGRSESATLTFRVVDQLGNGLSGVDVKFTPTTTTGGLLVSPTIATTDSNGNVSTNVASGTIPTPVKVSAEATRGGRTLSGLSDAVTISTGLPIQKSMSMSADAYNIEGWTHDGVTAKVTVRMADQYGNPVSDGTAVNFITEGGAIGSSLRGACLTNSGGCTVDLISQDFRPVNGRVTVLAYAQGIPTFTDLNGDGQYTCSAYTTPAGASPTTIYRPLVDICSTGEPFAGLADAYLDTDFNGVYEPSRNDLPVPFNGVYNSTPQAYFGIQYIRQSQEFVFSGSIPHVKRQFCDSADVCRDWVTATDGPERVIAGLAGPVNSCSPQRFVFRVYDDNNNTMPVDTSVSLSEVVKLAPGILTPDKIVSNNSKTGTIHSVTIGPEANCANGSFSVTVKTPLGTTALFPYATY